MPNWRLPSRRAGNDLFESFGRADEDNQSAMFAIVSHIYNELPSDCHGSYEIVDEWIDLHTQRRRLAAAVLPNSELPNPEPTP